MDVINRNILRIALPSIVSNITVPLLGLVDVAIVGHLGETAYIGAIAVGGMLFNMLCWGFAFLRMGTTGMTSQAYGQRDLKETVYLLVRSLGLAFGIGILLISLQYPVNTIAFGLIETTPEVQQYASLYFSVCIWGMPATLGLYAFTGWYIGMQNSRIPMFIAIQQNVLNIALSLFFVLFLGMKIEGVALGTLIAQYASLLTAGFLWKKYYKRLQTAIKIKTCVNKQAMGRFFQVNSNIFLRTMCLVAVTLSFTSLGAKSGEVILAVNTLLMQFFMFYSFIMDGFANAGEALTGRSIGSGNRDLLVKNIRRLFVWGFGAMLVFTFIYWTTGTTVIELLTDDKYVINASADYFYWVLAIPLAGVAAFVWDGIFIGATATRQMLYAMIGGMVTFFCVYYILGEVLGNHALWLAFILYLGIRGICLTLFYPRITSL